jgi:hypothetical protein
MPKQPMDTGTAVRLAQDQVITGRAVPLALERLARPKFPAAIRVFGRLPGLLVWCWEGC